MNLFIDTNVFLKFYRFSNDDLEELKKLLVLLRNNELTLFLPQQVVDEFNRNRESVIMEAVDKFRKEKVEKQFPHMLQQYSEYNDLVNSVKTFEVSKQALITKVLEDGARNSLKADGIIQDLFNSTKAIAMSEEAFKAAKCRRDVGNPPGKKDSYCDAINWEVLLETIPDNQDLVFVTDDGDYLSEINDDKFKTFLSAEWYNKKHSQIVLYKKLNSFFKDKFPHIKLASEYEKAKTIEWLAKSSSFAMTHSVLSELAKYEEFSESEGNAILLACLTNNQIIWIGHDYDVQENLKKILKASPSVDEELYEQFLEVYGDEDPAWEDDDFDAGVF